MGRDFLSADVVGSSDVIVSHFPIPSTVSCPGYDYKTKAEHSVTQCVARKAILYSCCAVSSMPVFSTASDSTRSRSFLGMDLPLYQYSEIGIYWYYMGQGAN
jgi:hypothetical protein